MIHFNSLQLLCGSLRNRQTRFLVMKQRKCGSLIYFAAILQHIDHLSKRRITELANL